MCARDLVTNWPSQPPLSKIAERRTAIPHWLARRNLDPPRVEEDFRRMGSRVGHVIRVVDLRWSWKVHRQGVVWGDTLEHPG